MPQIRSVNTGNQSVKDRFLPVHVSYSDVESAIIDLQRLYSRTQNPEAKHQLQILCSFYKDKVPLAGSVLERFNWEDAIKDKNAEDVKNDMIMLTTFLAAAGIAFGGSSPVSSSTSTSSVAENTSAAAAAGAPAAISVGSDVADEVKDAVQDVGESQSKQSDSNLMNLLSGLFGGDSSFSSGLASLLGTLGTTLGSSWLNMKNMKELIDYQNEYNTPANQMARFEEAGLNPNLVYGLGSNGNQPASGSIAPVDYDTALRERQSLQYQMKLQQRIADADIAQKMSVVALNDAQTRSAEQDAISKSNENSIFALTMRMRQEQLNEQLQNVRKAVAEADSKEAEAYYAMELKQLEKDIAENERIISNAQAGMISKDDQTYWISKTLDWIGSLLGSFGKGALGYKSIIDGNWKKQFTK